MRFKKIMTSNHSYHALVLAVFSACCSVLFGYSNVYAQEGEGGSFEFTCASWDRVVGTPIHYLAGKPPRNEDEQARKDRLKEVDVTEMTRSQAYEFKSGRKIQFYRIKSNAAGEDTMQVVASAAVPAGWKKVLFVFFPGKTKDSYRIYPLRDDRAFAPFGSYQFVNLARIPVAGFLDKKRMAIKPNSSFMVKLDGATPRPVNFGVWSMVDGKRVWLQRNTLTYKPTKYLIYFFYETKDRRGKMKLQSKGIVAFKPPPVDQEVGNP